MIDLNLNTKKILITGASGFIGKHLCNKISLMGGEVHGLSRSRQKSTDYHWIKVDLLEKEQIKKIVKEIKPDYVFHLAGYPYGSRDRALVYPSLQINTLSTVNLLDAVCEVGCERFILTGSMEEHAGNNQTNPTSPYAITKYMSTLYGKLYHSLYDLPVVIPRLFMVYGPGQAGKHLKKLIPYVITSYLDGKIPNIGSGQRKIDWIYVEDVVDGLLSSLEPDKAIGETYDIGTGLTHPISSIVGKIREILGAIDEPNIGAITDRKFEENIVADVKRTRQLIGWEPKYDVDEGLRKTVLWYQNNYNCT